ncbi:hypothetical protein M422DRAFT_776470 [Sphaerobolus stellatus SS14]|nr:hypothetical protein M422DRAFT_776470 [Sphaerobolus stellatus SS14]
MDLTTLETCKELQDEEWQALKRTHLPPDASISLSIGIHFPLAIATSIGSSSQARPTSETFITRLRTGAKPNIPPASPNRVLLPRNIPHRKPPNDNRNHIRLQLVTFRMHRADETDIIRDVGRRISPFVMGGLYPGWGGDAFFLGIIEL